MIISYEGRIIRLPDFLIPGAARCGTTALYERLRKHPDVFMPDEKEPMFFSVWSIGKLKEWVSGDLVDDWTIPDLKEYSRLFENAKGHQKLGEASVWYLYDHQNVIQNIKKLYGSKTQDLKIVIMLRDPVERAWSHYCHKISRIREDLSFKEAIKPDTIRERLKRSYVLSYDYIGFGQYADQVQAWLSAFPNHRVWIYEEFFSNLPASMEKLTNFLEIEMDPSVLIDRQVNPGGLYGNKLREKIAKSLVKPSIWKSSLKMILPFRLRRRMKLGAIQRLVTKIQVPEQYRENLIKLFAKEIQNLELLLGRSLDIWRDPTLEQAGPE
jgi:hypothetical protein